MTIKERLNLIKDELSAISISGNFPNCSTADRVFDKLTAIAEGAKKHIAKGRTVEGFAIGLKVYLKGKALCSKADTSSGAWQDTDVTAIEVMEAAVLAAGDATEREYMFSELLKSATKKEAYDWDGDFELLRIATKLITAKNNKQWLDKLAEIGEFHCKQPYSQWKQYSEILLMAECTLHFEPAAYVSYLDAHLDVEEIRKRRVELAIKNGELDSAEKLALEGFKKYQKFSHNFWAESLVEIYKKSRQIEKLLAFFEELLFKSMHSQKYDAYDEMKAIYTEQGVWAAEYKRILEKAFTTHRELYISILEREQDWEHYIEALQASPKKIYDSGKKFVKEYPARVYALYRIAILSDAETANNRKNYYWIAKQIKEMVKLGGIAEAEALIDELIRLYPNRPAMIDELELASQGKRSKAWDNRRRW